jgi:pyrroline-5-carboxylate reductase
MGVAIVSGILDSISHPGTGPTLPRSSSSGTSTPLQISAITHRMPSKFIACIKRDESARNLRHIFDHSVEVLCRENVRGAKSADLILLGSKPNMCKEILTERGMREALEGKLLISIATGVTIAQLREWCPESTHVVRAMPNVPCKVRSLCCGGVNRRFARE